jgi:hypothetical protein
MKIASQLRSIAPLFAVVLVVDTMGSTSSELVTQERTAILIAEAIAAEAYGPAIVDSQRPFSAVRKGDKWLVRGYIPPLTPGGVAKIEVSVRDGRILSLIHGK